MFLNCQVHTCPGNCKGKWECKASGVCACKEGFGGPDCMIEYCPRNCSWHLHQGFCDHVSAQQRRIFITGCACDTVLFIEMMF